MTFYESIKQMKEIKNLRKFTQEIIVHADGSLEIPWITPDATPLILEIWEAVLGCQPFFVREGQSCRIYCG